MKRLSSSAHNEVVLANFMQPAGTGRRTDQAAQIGTRLSSARSCARRQCGGDATDGSCHRRIIADYLIAAGDTVFHILGRKHLEQAHMRMQPRSGPAGTLTYSAEVAKYVGVCESIQGQMIKTRCRFPQFPTILVVGH